MATLPLLLVLLTGIPVGSQAGTEPKQTVGPRGEDPSGVTGSEEPPHDLHISYGNLGVEGAVAILQLRVFKDDLEEALRRVDDRESFLMEVSPEVDGVFLRYISRKFVLEVDGENGIL